MTISKKARELHSARAGGHGHTAPEKSAPTEFTPDPFDRLLYLADELSKIVSNFSFSPQVQEHLTKLSQALRKGPVPVVALEPKPEILITISGPPGVGKTLLGNFLAVNVRNAGYETTHDDLQVTFGHNGYKEMRTLKQLGKTTQATVRIVTTNRSEG